MTDKVILSIAGAVASYGWLSTANDIATLVVSVIAIIGGGFAASNQYAKYKARKENKDGS